MGFQAAATATGGDWLVGISQRGLPLSFVMLSRATQRRKWDMAASLELALELLTTLGQGAGPSL